MDYWRRSDQEDQARFVWYTRSMPLPKRPFVASADQVRITRDGDVAVIEYADESVATTHLTVGADKLDKMNDEQLLEYWNDLVRGNDEFRATVKYVATEIPVGKPQVSYFELGDQWTPRGHVIRCQIVGNPAGGPDLDDPFVSIDGKDFTLRQFTQMTGTFGGWGMRIEFVPADELHVRPKVKVGEPKE